jgi:hypothetical protein
MMIVASTILVRSEETLGAFLPRIGACLALLVLGYRERVEADLRERTPRWHPSWRRFEPCGRLPVVERPRSA